MISVEIKNSVLFESTPSVNGVPVIALPENHHVRIAVPQAPLVFFHCFPLTSNNVKLMLFIAAFLIYEAQNVVYWMPSRHVSIHNQVLHLSLSSVYLLILCADFSPCIPVLVDTRAALQDPETQRKVVIEQSDLHVFFVYHRSELSHFSRKYLFTYPLHEGLGFRFATSQKEAVKTGFFQ